jgi:integrase/recombinase XerD
MSDQSNFRYGKNNKSIVLLSSAMTLAKSYPPKKATVTRASNDSQMVKLWLNTKAASSQQTYSSAVNQFLAWVNKPLREVMLEDVQSWVQALSKFYKPNTVKVKLNSVKSLLGFAQKVGYLQFNVGAATKAPKAKQTLANRILSEGEVLKLIDAAQPGRDKTMLKLIYATGIRVSEAIGLTWSDLSAKGNGGQATIYGKGSSTRVVLIPAKLWSEVMALQAITSDKSDAVFQSRTGKHLDRVRVHRIVKAAAQRAGIDAKASSHWLRHSHATHAIERDCPLHLLQQSMGHSSIAVTGVYLHSRPDQGSSQFLSGLI